MGVKSYFIDGTISATLGERHSSRRSNKLKELQSASVRDLGRYQRGLRGRNGTRPPDIGTLRPMFPVLSSFGGLGHLTTGEAEELPEIRILPRAFGSFPPSLLPLLWWAPGTETQVNKAVSSLDGRDSPTQGDVPESLKTQNRQFEMGERRCRGWKRKSFLYQFFLRTGSPGPSPAVETRKITGAGSYRPSNPARTPGSHLTFQTSKPSSAPPV